MSVSAASVLQEVVPQAGMAVPRASAEVRELVSGALLVVALPPSFEENLLVSAGV